MPMQFTRDQSFKVVLNLRTPVSGGNETVGSGLFIVNDSQVPYILTASHVANSCNSSTTVVIADAAGNSTSLNLSQFNSAITWNHHSVADVSVLEVIPSSATSSYLNKRFFPTNQLNVSTAPPSRDDYLTAVGFPHGLGAIGHFSPFTFRSHASSSLITLPRFDTNAPCDFFALEDPSIGGYSGGPVFDLGYILVGAMQSVTGPTICHGIIHGTISDGTGGAIAAVTPCSYVNDLI